MNADKILDILTKEQIFHYHGRVNVYVSWIMVGIDLGVSGSILKRLKSKYETSKCFSLRDLAREIIHTWIKGQPPTETPSLTDLLIALDSNNMNEMAVALEKGLKRSRYEREGVGHKRKVKNSSGASKKQREGASKKKKLDKVDAVSSSYWCAHFHKAIMRNDPDEVIGVLQSRSLSQSDLNSTSRDGNAALHLVAKFIDSPHDAIQISQMIITLGGDAGKLNAENQSFLNELLSKNLDNNSTAVTSDQCHEMFKFLVDNGYKYMLSRTEHAEWSPLFSVIKKIEMSDNLIRYLHFNNINLSIKSRWIGNSCLYYAISGTRSIHMIRKLVQYGADLTAINNIGWNLLHVSAYYKHSEAFCFVLIELGKRNIAHAYLTAKTKSSFPKTPIQMACKNFEGDLNSLGYIQQCIGQVLGYRFQL